MVRHSYVDKDGVVAPHSYGLVVHLGLEPLAPELVSRRVSLLEPLYKEVLVISARMGHAPGYPFIVAEVGEARYPGEREAHRIEFRARYMVLVVDVRRIQSSVRITSK